MADLRIRSTLRFRVCLLLGILHSSVADKAIDRELGEACVTALATREGVSREDVLATLGKSGLTYKDEGCASIVASASPLASWFRSLNSALTQSGALVQWFISIGSIIVGVVCAWDGPVIWQVVFTVMTAALAAGITHHEARLWNLAPALFSEMVLQAQAAAAMALAVHVGFEGSQFLLGALLGVIAAYGFGDWARGLDGYMPGAALLWYEVGAVVGVLIYTAHRRPTLALLMPFMGTFLITVGSGVILSRIIGFIGDAPAWLPRDDAPWLAAATGLLGKAGAATFTLHVAWIFVGVLLHTYFNVRILTIVFLVSIIGITGLSSATGCFCFVYPAMECPSWLGAVDDWHWPFFGCFVWSCLMGVAVWRQMGLLEAWFAYHSYDDVASVRGFVAEEGERVARRTGSKTRMGSKTIAPAAYEGDPGGPIDNVMRGLGGGWWTNEDGTPRGSM